jgi:hypothetical protein
MQGNTPELAIKILNEMNNRANEDGVYIGALTKLFDELQVPRTYYGHIVSVLESVGAAAQLVRGNAMVPSKWQIVNPDPSLLKGAPSLYAKRKGRMQGLEAQIRSLQASDAALIRKINRLEDQVKILLASTGDANE